MTSPNLRGAQVLIVEDEYFIAADLARAVDTAGGKPVGPAGSVEQARALLGTQAVNAVVLDLNLHGDMAFRLVDELRERGVACVILSGYSPESLPDSVRDVPSLEKPIDYDKVVNAVQSQLKTAAL
jgi:ActR/RegA family two-component response regulator